MSEVNGSVLDELPARPSAQTGIGSSPGVPLVMVTIAALSGLFAASFLPTPYGTHAGAGFLSTLVLALFSLPVARRGASRCLLTFGVNALALFLLHLAQAHHLHRYADVVLTEHTRMVVFAIVLASPATLIVTFSGQPGRFRILSPMLTSLVPMLSGLTYLLITTREWERTLPNAAPPVVLGALLLPETRSWLVWPVVFSSFWALAAAGDWLASTHWVQRRGAAATSTRTGSRGAAGPSILHGIAARISPALHRAFPAGVRTAGKMAAACLLAVGAGAGLNGLLHAMHFVFLSGKDRFWWSISVDTLLTLLPLSLTFCLPLLICGFRQWATMSGVLWAWMFLILILRTTYGLSLGSHWALDLSIFCAGVGTGLLATHRNKRSWKTALLTLIAPFGGAVLLAAFVVRSGGVQTLSAATSSAVAVFLFWVPFVLTHWLGARWFPEPTGLAVTGRANNRPVLGPRGKLLSVTALRSFAVLIGFLGLSIPWFVVRARSALQLVYHFRTNARARPPMTLMRTDLHLRSGRARSNQPISRVELYIVTGRHPREALAAPNKPASARDAKEYCDALSNIEHLTACYDDEWRSRVQRSIGSDDTCNGYTIADSKTASSNKLPAPDRPFFIERTVTVFP